MGLGPINDSLGGGGLVAGNVTIDGDVVQTGGSNWIKQITAPGAPTAVIAAPAVAGNMDNGSHDYKVTFVTALKETEGGTASAAVVIVDKTVNGKASLTAIPTSSNAAVTSRSIYRRFNGAGTYKLLTTIADNSTTTYTDNTANAGLGADMPTTNSTGSLLVDGNMTILGNLNFGDASVDSFSINGSVSYNTGAAIDGTKYQAQRDTDGTNQYHINVPTGASIEMSENDSPMVVVQKDATYNHILKIKDSTTPPTELQMASFLEAANAPKAVFLAGQDSTDATIVFRYAHKDSSAGTKIPVSITAMDVNEATYTDSDRISMTVSSTLASLSSTNGPAGPSLVPMYIGTSGATNTGIIKLDTAANGQAFSLTPTTTTSGTISPFVMTDATPTGITAATERIAVDYNLSSTKTWADGAGPLVTQREFVVRAPTYAGGAGGALTMTRASTLDVTGAPVAGPNMTLTTANAINTESWASNASNSNAVSISMPSIASGTLATTNHVGLSISGAPTISLGDQTATTVLFANLYIPNKTYTSTTNVRTVTTMAGIYLQAPTAGANVSVGSGPYALFVDDGTSRFDGRILGGQGADVASANDLTLGSDGNTFEVTGAVQINAITTAGWENGSVVNLLFTSTPTVKHNTAGGAGTAVILLAGSADAVLTAGSRIQLVLSEIGGVQAWREMSRTFV